MHIPARSRGFTLIELLVVIGILAVLLAIVLIAINPARQFEQANNTQRSSDVNAILNAVHQYMVENAGSPGGLGITETPTEITEAQALCAALVPTFIAALPVDPTQGDPISDCAVEGGFSTRYAISQSGSDARITVSSLEDATITVTR